jgi:hypothetical protein
MTTDERNLVTCVETQAQKKLEKCGCQDGNAD